MKIPLISDSHFGIKNDSSTVRNYSMSFINQFFKYIDDNNIKEIIHLGDFLDRRRFVNYETLNFVRKHFIEQLKLRGIKMHLILGNHDCYFKNTNDLNSPKELMSNYDNVVIYDKPCEVEINQTKYAFIPWLTEETFDDFKFLLQNTTAKYAMGHLEIQGFQVLRGIKSEKGLPLSCLTQFEYVFSGHYHVKQDNGHVYYLGTPYDMTFADIDEKKGFHVFDDTTKQLEFYENKNKLFHKFVYDDSGIIDDTQDFTKYSNCYVKIVVKNKKKPILFDKILDKIHSVNPAHVSVIDETELYVEEQEIDQTQDTMTIICSDIDNMKDIEKPDKLKQIMNELFVESFEIE